MSRNFKQRSVSSHDFAMIPSPEVPRSSFRMTKGLKTTFDTGFLVPCFCEEVLPGDTFSVKMTSFVRLSTPLFPFMDNLHMESFFFFVPNRLTMDNWVKLMGEQKNPGDSIDYLVPQIASPLGGFPVLSIYDYFGLPTFGQMNAAGTIAVSALPLRAYNLIYNEWFRSEDLQNSLPVNTGDGPDSLTDYALVRRGKRPDYFTMCLPWPLKGGVNVPLPLGGTAPIVAPGSVADTVGVVSSTGVRRSLAGNVPLVTLNAAVGTVGTDMYADLNAVTGATINALRQSFAIQKMLERDARGGTRYTEKIAAHFKVKSPDARLQRPEYLGGGSSPITVNAVTQNTQPVADGTTPLGTLAATAQGVGQHGFSQSFTEHGYVIGLMNVRADLTYQQGIRKHWLRRTQYDHYFPAFATLGEQAVLSKEIYCDGTAGDDDVFGYQERWAEYRYNPSEITGLMRSTAAGTIDAWHLAQRFATRPTLSPAFIEENPPMDRVLAVGPLAGGQQLIGDFFFEIKAARPMPMYSVPGMIDRF